MILNNISFSQFIVGKLRQNLEDYNLSDRNGSNWIFPDSPMITKLLNNKNNFPRISVEILNQPTVEEVGMGCSDQLQQVFEQMTQLERQGQAIAMQLQGANKDAQYDPSLIS